jgi:chromosome partitioning protein
MKVITVAAPKGGSGKSTVASVLAVRAAMESARVAMFDLNADQASLTQWWVLRGEPMNPRLIEPENLARDIEVLKAEGFDWLIMDTPPIDTDLIELAVLKSDAVVIPVRASVFDIGAIEAIVEICKNRRKPFAFLLSAVDTKFKTLNEKAKASLVTDGPIFANFLSYRMAYINALTAGKVGFEIDKTLQPEVDGLWTEVKRLAAHGPMPAMRRAANE